MNVAPNEGRACVRWGPLLAAYADGSLGPEQAGSVEDHVLACQSCADEVSDLRRVRSLLSAGAAYCRPSPELSQRLISIAGSIPARDPLWLRPGGVGTLPSARQLRYHRARLFVGVAVAAVLVLLAMTNLASIDARIITDPGKVARSDFTAWLATDTMNQSVAVVLMAQNQGADLVEGTAEPQRPVWQVPTVAVSGSDLTSSLSFLNHLSFSMSGLQRVSVAAGSGWVSAQVMVVSQPDRGTTLTVLGQNGQDLLTQRAPRSTGQSNHLMTMPGLSLRASQPGAIMMIGRSAQLVEALWHDSVVARWWIDPANGSLLWMERYSRNGALEVSAGYETVETGEDSALALTAAKQEMAGFPGPSSIPGNWCVVLQECPETLAGLPLVSYTRSGTADAPVMRLIYSDGMTTVAVAAQPGFLDLNGTLTRELSSTGIPNLLAWQSGETVISLATNGGRELVQEARAKLPNHEPEDPNIWWQIKTGFGRLLGLR